MAVTEGEAPPAFTLADTDGAAVSLADFAGRDLVVYFYPKDDTPGCTKEACGFRDLWNDYEAAGVAVLGVSPDEGASHRKFIDKYQLPFTLLSDPEPGDDGGLRRLGRKDDVRPEDGRRDSVHGLDRCRRHRAPPLASGEPGGGPSGEGAGGHHQRLGSS